MEAVTPRDIRRFGEVVVEIRQSVVGSCFVVSVLAALATEAESEATLVHESLGRPRHDVVASVESWLRGNAGRMRQRLEEKRRPVPRHRAM